jgi:hypothetical protein
MADDLSVAAERLRTSAQRLNAVCDVAAKTIREVEAFLEEAHVGLEASVEFRRDQEDDEGLYCTNYLGYGRHTSGKFRVLITYHPSWAREPDDISVRPWSECSRDDKLDSFEKLPELVVELARRVDERTAKADQIVAAVNASLQLPKQRKGG